MQRFCWRKVHYFFLLILALRIAAPCRAHDAQLSSLKFIRARDGTTVISLTTHVNKIRAANPTETNLDAAIRRRLKIRFDGALFIPGKSHVAIDKANHTIAWQAEYSRPAARIEVLAPLYPEDLSSRCVIAIFEKGRVSQQAILSSTHPKFDSFEKLSAQQSTPGAATLSIIRTSLREGIVHIFGGLDHVCFVLGLLLLGGTMKALLKTATAFTLAHSITLTLAVLEIYAPPSRVVEPIIALSIVAIALENFRHHRVKEISETQTDWRPFLAFAFGLIHGFGFAGALGELGLPRHALGWALTAFNIGVELGQAAIILAVAPLLAWLARASPKAHRHLVLAASSGIVACGVFWFVQRVTGV